jgi:hypothetical protein
VVSKADSRSTIAPIVAAPTGLSATTNAAVAAAPISAAAAGNAVVGSTGVGSAGGVAAAVAVIGEREVESGSPTRIASGEEGNSHEPPRVRTPTEPTTFMAV